MKTIIYNNFIEILSFESSLQQGSVNPSNDLEPNRQQSGIRYSETCL